MNFLEVITSKKPFKRPNYKDWIIENPEALEGEDGVPITEKTENILKGTAYIWLGSGKAVFFAKQALLATDWEVKE